MSHVTGAQETPTRFGTLRTFINLTSDGKPLPPTEEPEHILDDFCWCQPLVEMDVATGDHLFVHRWSVDLPHIEHVEGGGG